VSEGSEPILRIDGLLKRFGGVTAVDGCGFQVMRDSMTGLIGPNGSGKTTTFDLITGFQRPDRGTIYFENNRIDGDRPYRIARNGLGRTFQITRVFPQMTVLENLLVGATGTELRSAAARALHLLDLVGLSDLRDEFCSRLSFGQQKLVEMARIHMRPQKLVLLDEPFAGVNPTLTEKLVAYIEELRGEGTTYLIIDHEMKLIMRICDRILVLDQGKLLTEGSPEEVQTNSQVLSSYFGDK
jgi:ABC-type branched-subunit amino acid transport system ATPase component